MRRLQKFIFDCYSEGVWRTPPKVSNRFDVTIVTMLGRKEIYMYLLAVKSFCYHLGFVPRPVVLNDGSLDRDDEAFIKYHLPDAEIFNISDITPGKVPIGGSWERLLLIARIVQETYVIQLDTDTLTLDHPLEVQGCINDNRSFILAGACADHEEVFVRTKEDIAQMALSYGTPMLVQKQAERHISKISYARYVKGNSGFTGFAKGSFTRKVVEAVSAEFAALVGDQWNEWGSEQVATNTIIANTANAKVLSHPAYRVFTGIEQSISQTVFVHFIGRHRYEKGVYLSSAKEIIRTLEDTVAQVPLRETLMLEGSRLRGEGSRLQAEASRLQSSGIPELEKAGHALWHVGAQLSSIGDSKFIKGEKLR